MSIDCICGADLARGKFHGIWTLGATQCEYVTCASCLSTRALMPPDREGHWRVHAYADPRTSEVAGEWDSLLDALDVDPPSDHATLMRNGRTLAVTAVVPSTGERLWFVRRPV